MINFIIYDDDPKIRHLYLKIIHKYMGIKNDNYKVYQLDKYNEKIGEKIANGITGRCIYLLDYEVPNRNGVELAKMVRESGDWISPIIVITMNDIQNIVKFSTKLLMLDFIKKNEVMKKLPQTLNVAFSILNSQSTLSFKCNSEIFQIPYDDICYFEKNLNGNDSTIYTKDNSYTIRYTINKLADIVRNDPRFFKTHRSCIINLNNVINYDIENNIIKFKHGETNLISRTQKEELKARLINK